MTKNGKPEEKEICFKILETIQETLGFSQVLSFLEKDKHKMVKNSLALFNNYNQKKPKEKRIKLLGMNSNEMLNNWARLADETGRNMIRREYPKKQADRIFQFKEKMYEMIDKPLVSIH